MVRFTTQFFILDKAKALPILESEQGVKQCDLRDNGRNTIKGVGRQRDKNVWEAGERGTGSGRL